MKSHKPKDIGLVVATKTEALWIQVRDVRIAKIQELEDSLIVEKEVLKLAEKIIKEEQCTQDLS